MTQTSSTHIRTVALVGHGAAGKTTLAESLLAATGAITGRGTVEKGNTTCDFDPLEKEFGHSLQTALASMQWDGAQLHLIDTPGYPDFAGQAIAALAGVDTALIVINAQTGIELATDRMFTLAGERGLCRMIVVNKIDADNVDLPALVNTIRERFGKQCLLLDLPAHDGKDVVELLGHADGESDFASVAAAHRALIDQIIEEDDSLIKQVPKAELISIITPRIEEIFELVNKKLAEHGLRDISSHRVVLTGGGAQLSGIRDIANMVLDKQVRIGRPKNVINLPDNLYNPCFSTAIGLLLFALNYSEKKPNKIISKPASSGTSFGRILDWLKQSF